MKTKLAIYALCCFVMFSISCGVINNSKGIVVFNPDSVQYGNVYVYSIVNQDILVTNIGFNDVVITDARIEIDNSNTVLDEFKITSSPTCVGQRLSKRESCTVTVKFSPKSEGDKKAKLIIDYISGVRNRSSELELSGSAYSGTLNVTPSLIDFPTSYVGEERLNQIIVTNTDSQALTVTSISISNLGSTTAMGEFQIISGWNGSSFKLQKGESKVIELKFYPQTLGTKSANVIIKVAESYFDFYIYLKGECCDQLEITTPDILPNGKYQNYYCQVINCKGGDVNYSLSVMNNALPKDLTLICDTICGTLEEYGDKTFTIIAKDDSGHSVNKTFKLTIEYAMLIRDSADVDQKYKFDTVNDTGFYTVNLICKGNIPLTLNSITLSGAGFNSGEAKFLTKPNLPLVMNDGDRAQIVIKVESILDYARSVILNVDHSGFNSPFKKEFFWWIGNGDRHVFVLYRGSNMSSLSNIGTPVYDKNGNIITNPTRWQVVQYLVSDYIMNYLTDDDSFDIITFSTQSYFCFAQLKKATIGNKSVAIAWLYSQNPSSCDNSYDALKAAYSNYGYINTVWFFSSGYPNTALSLGYGACSNTNIANRLVTDLKTWMQPQITADSAHKLKAIQIGGTPLTFMQQIGALPNAEFSLR